jgi:ABC-type transport system substrate-binding protein
MNHRHLDRAAIATLIDPLRLRRRREEKRQRQGGQRRRQPPRHRTEEQPDESRSARRQRQRIGPHPDLCCSGLIKVTPELDYAPDVAARWETPDDKTIVFKLNPNAKFQNGRPSPRRT